MLKDSGPLNQDEIDFLKDFIPKLGFGNTVDNIQSSIYKNWTKPSEVKALTIRELTIFKHFSNGSELKEIADILGTSHRTIKRDSINAMTKLGVFNRAHAVADLFRLKLLD